MKKLPRVDLDDVVRQHTDGRYVEQSLPGANPERDKLVNDALVKRKQTRTVAKARQ